MGYEQVNATAVTHRNLWAGWFPAKVQADIPGDLFDPSVPIGFRDCNNIIYSQGKLKKFFGYTAVTSPALQAGADVSSLFYSFVHSKLIGTVGTKLYKDLDTATPTDVTGTATITSGTQTDITEWQFETTKLAIGCQQGNAPWKWNGTDDASNLGATAPAGKWVKSWQNALWIACTATEPSTLYFSNLGDATTFTTDDDYKFDAPITGLGILGPMLVVFMEDHIGVLSGTNNRLLTKVDRFINSVGCTGGFTIRNAFVDGEEVLIFHGRDGFYAFNGSRQPVKLSNAISNKYTSGTSASRWNDQRLANAWATYSAKNNLYLCGISDGSDTENGFLIALDLSRPYQLPDNQGFAVPHWPISDQTEEINCIAVARDSSSVEYIYFGSDDGIVYKYDAATFNRNGNSYTSYGTSKIFDPVQTLLLLESNIIGDDEGSSGTLQESVNFDMATGLGQSNSQDMTESADVLDTTFILDTSALSSQEFVFKNFAIANNGRFFQFDVRNSTLDHKMNIQGVNFVFKPLGLIPNAGV